jgi:hypothetical protein
MIDPLIQTKTEWMYYIAKVASCAIEEVQMTTGNMVLTTEPLITGVDAMNNESFIDLLKKYARFIYAINDRQPNDEEMKADAPYIMVKPWVYVSKTENSINNFVELRNDKVSIEDSLISATTREEQANLIRMHNEAKHADAGTGFLIKMKDYSDKFPETTLLTASGSAERSLYGKAVSTASGNRNSRNLKNFLKSCNVHNADPSERGDIFRRLSVFDWTFRGASKEGAFAWIFMFDQTHLTEQQLQKRLGTERLAILRANDQFMDREFDNPIETQ